MRVVIDTNSLLVSIGRRSKYRPIFDSIISGQIKVIISNDVLTEYVEIIGQRTNPVVANNIASFLVRSPDVEHTNIYFKWAAIDQDADDNKFVDCALNGNAEYIVTDDRHFNILKDIEFPKIKIIKTAAFVKLIG
jgi:putative PIN family toxin of toxin-antitoxin system